MAAGKVKVITKKAVPSSIKSHKGHVVSCGKKVTHVLRYVPKMKNGEYQSYDLQINVLRSLTLPIKRIEPIKLSLKLLGEFVAQNSPLTVALPIKSADEGFDPNSYKLFTLHYNPYIYKPVLEPNFAFSDGFY